MKCVRSPDSRTPSDSLRGIVRPLIRIAVFVLRHGPAGTIPGSNVSVVDNLVICRPAARDRTLLSPSNLQVGTFNLTTNHNEMETTNRETLHRAGPHPHRSICTSFDPHVIFMHHIDFNSYCTGHVVHTYSSQFGFMYKNMHGTPGLG